MRKQIDKQNDIITIKPRKHDAAAKLKQVRTVINDRINESNQEQQAILTARQRDLLIIALAQQVGLID